MNTYTRYITVLVIVTALVGVTAVHAEDGSGKGRTFLGIHFGAKIEDSNESQDDTKGSDDRNGQTSKGIRADMEDDDIKGQVTGDIRTRAVTEIDRRIESLNKLEARVSTMSRVSDASKASIKTTIDAQIKVLSDLKVKIQADTDDATLKADIASITKAYRIYMLVIPQGAVLAAADRISTTADLMTTFGAKLDTRIIEAKTAGKDVTVLENASIAMKAKIADAKVQATAAINLTSNLRPDNGDQATVDANKKAMTDARAKIKLATEDLKAARKDAETIVKGLKSFNSSVDAKVKIKDR